MSYPYPAHTAAPRRKRSPWVLLLTAAVVVLLLFAFIAILSDAAGRDPAPAAPTVPNSAVNSTVNPTKAAPGPLTTFGPGTYEVGTGSDQVAAGKYKTVGPEDGLSSCYWARQRDTEGGFDSIIANDNVKGPTTLSISKNDKAFKTDCNWIKAN